MGHIIRVMQRTSNQKTAKEDKCWPSTGSFRNSSPKSKEAKYIFVVGKSNWVKEAKLGWERRREEHKKTWSLKRGLQEDPGAISILPPCLRLGLPDTELLPYVYLAASCRNLSSH